MKDNITLLIAIASLAVSLASLGVAFVTLWLSQIRRGRLRMTQPTLLVILREGDDHRPKIFLRTLLYGSSAKGCVIESMYLQMHQQAGSFIFDFWSYGETSRLSIGSGLFVGREGVSYDHHFLLRRGTSDFLLWDGECRVEVFANVVGRRHPIPLHTVTVAITSTDAATMVQILDAAMFFEWQADTRQYTGHVEREPDPSIRST